MSDLEELFLHQLKAEGLPRPEVREFKFHPTRKWRVDFLYNTINLVVEIEGGQWLGSKGGHTSGKGYEKNCEKYNELTALGYRLLRFTGGMLRNGIAMEQMRRALT